jgi:hypothetical protein
MASGTRSGRNMNIHIPARRPPQDDFPTRASKRTKRGLCDEGKQLVAKYMKIGWSAKQIADHLQTAHNLPDATIKKVSNRMQYCKTNALGSPATTSSDLLAVAPEYAIGSAGEEPASSEEGIQL